MSSPEVQQSLKMAETLANDPEALGRFQQQLASALGAWPNVYVYHLEGLGDSRKRVFDLWLRH